MTYTMGEQAAGMGARHRKTQDSTAEVITQECPCRDCRPSPVIPLPVPHYDCCGQSRRAPWCHRSTV